MASDLIRYDLLTQDAMRQLVRHVIADVARDGYLPGDHHFYIAFLTGHRGARLSPRLREQYPEEMTIILQHQFEDLEVTERFFEVTLHFGGRPERLTVPFDAITQFFDPSVNFGLKFEVSGAKPASDSEDKAPAPPSLATADKGSKRGAGPRGAGSEPQTLPPRQPDDAGKAGGAEAAGKVAEVVSLDKFRKK